MKNILMIATGGTIASKEGDLGLTPAVTGEELAASVPGIKDICHLEILQLMNIDSTNMRPRQWLMIRDAIMENYNHYVNSQGMVDSSSKLRISFYYSFLFTLFYFIIS